MINENHENVRKLVSKWESILEDENFGKITDSYKKGVLAVLLENQQGRSFEEARYSENVSGLTSLLEAAPTNAMGASSSTAGDGAIDIYDPVLIALLRRAVPNMIAFDVCRRTANVRPNRFDFCNALTLHKPNRRRSTI